MGLLPKILQIALALTRHKFSRGVNASVKHDVNSVADIYVIFQHSFEIFNGVGIDVNKIRELKIQLICGELDTEVHGGEEFWGWLKSMKAKHSEGSGGSELKVSNDAIGRAADRIGTLRQVKSDWEALGIKCQLDIVPDAKHEADKILPAALKSVRPLIEKARSDHDMKDL